MIEGLKKVIIFFFIFLFSTAEAISENNPAIAMRYVKQAEERLQAGDQKNAFRLLEISYEFYPDFSESNYLYASVYLKNQETTFLGLDYLEKSLQSDTWTKTDTNHAKEELAEVFFRTGQHKRAHHLLSGLVALGYSGLNISILQAKSFLALGMVEEAERFLVYALKQHTGSDELYLLYTGLLFKSGKVTEAHTILDRGLNAAFSLPLIYYNARIDEYKEQRLKLLEEYFNRSGRDPGAVILALESGADDPEKFLELFMEFSGNEDISHLDTLFSILKDNSELTGILKTKISGYSGTRIVDRNKDGYYEEKYNYSDGVLDKWILDENQDGLSEAEINFRFKEPVSFIRFKKGKIIYEYSRYPYLKQVVFEEQETRRRVYRILPFQFSFPILENSEKLYEKMQLPFLYDSTWPEEVDIIKQSCSRKDYEGDNPLRQYFYLNGRITRLDQDPDKNGKFRHILYYENELPVTGCRDLDGDRRYEINEVYSNGSLVKITWDQDGDGNPEYMQILKPVMEMLWDYNDDGIFDSREYNDNRGRIIREFSSRLDGVFDLKTVYKAGKQVEE